jgi:hypothetical protein
MKRLFILYTIVFAFGYGLGCIKNHTLDFAAWGYNSSKYVSIWWILMGFAVTGYCTGRYFIDKLMDDHQDEKEAFKEI